MKKLTITQEFSFTKPAVYKIHVQGDLGTSSSAKLGGMQITLLNSKNREPESMLIGRITDQAALSGILYTLYELHLTILSVSMLSDKK